MNDLPPDVERLQTLRTYLELQLAQVTAAIRQAEADEQRRRQEAHRARAEQAWKLEPQRAGSTALLHRGGCGLYNATFGLLNQSEARLALVEDGIEPCAICRPQAGLTE
ncbi:DUF6233 domain-containing protein [Streptomyces sp. NPDC056437]|uniref:DUF6233 domain-containing protein n=1 Tax=Streptomyces sp. NPDC056437 TaxID=3345816 RepID=UPI0036A58BB8